MLRRDEHRAGRKHVVTLIKKMGIEALYKKPATSRRHPEHAVYPYLLRAMQIKRANCVWAADISYIPMKRLSNMLTADFCIDGVQEAMQRYGTPEIFNTDQGNQFTSIDFTRLLKDNGIAISMDGKGCWRDNVFVERLWKSIK